MDKRLYKIQPKAAEVLFGTAELLLVAMLIERAAAGRWLTAGLYAAIAVALAAVRFVKGPLSDPVLEVANGELIWRQPFYIPTKIRKTRLESIRTLKIVGPRGDRRYRITHADGSQDEVRPYYGRSFEPKVIDFLKSALPKEAALTEEEPPHLLSRMRGEF